jgi:KDO2-lipid IV(A) lauroyltransferase
VSKRIKRSPWVKRLEYAGTFLLVPILERIAPHKFRELPAYIGHCMFYLLAGRRRIALANLAKIFGGKKPEREIKTVAVKSQGGLLLSIWESIWFRRLLEEPSGVLLLQRTVVGLDEFLGRARALHEQSGGCIFVTPHFGGYGLLPYLFAAARIPVTIPIQERANPYIQRRWCPLNRERVPGGEIFVSKTNSLGALQAALREGRSVGMMPDQRTMRGLPIDFLGHVAPTTPIPSVLAINYRRPIVVGACCRRTGAHPYELKLYEPIFPDASQGKRENVVRMSREMNQAMESIIRADPEQYLWMHNRWKPYSSKKKGSSRFLPKAGE